MTFGEEIVGVVVQLMSYEWRMKREMIVIVIVIEVRRNCIKTSELYISLEF